jgi:hypothetical protein
LISIDHAIQAEQSVECNKKAQGRTAKRLPEAAAGAGLISGGSLATVAMPISATPVSGVPIDPIYDAIEAHRKAYATMQTAFAEHRKAHEIADARSVRLISRAW